MIENEQNNRERIAGWLRLHLTDQVGAITFARLLKHFGGVEEALEASAGYLASVPGIGVKTARRITESRDLIDVEEELDLADELGVRIITLDCPDYPPLLKQIHDPPAVLYVKGDLTREDELAVAVVGSRSCSHYGHEQASRLSHLLAAAGFTIVSGLARGIDSAAHRGAIAADGRTIAVQGRGLAGVFPPENTDLAQLIAENGALVSELPLRYEPLSGTFPARNRIISGLSLATIVVEARKRSGALITAQSAMEQNREVMAVPGRVDAPGSVGPHKLIKDGAVLVENIQDILEALGQVGKILKSHAAEAATKAQRAVEPALFNLEQIRLTETESAVFDCLDLDPSNTEHIISQSQVAPSGVYASLTSLQLKGLVKQLPGGFYQKNRMGND
jgi:DNA processing protein